MKNLFQADAVDEVIGRIDKLEPATPRQWGKMDAAQMLAHCGIALDIACGHLNLPRIFIGRLLGPLARSQYSNDKPFSRNGPTGPELRISGPRDFSKEQQHLEKRIREFHAGGEAKCTKHPHPFFGALTAQEWATGMYKHLDHHLRQFGV